MSAFDPIIGGQPKTLVLGSMPGQVSLGKGEYYAHPRNSFWWIMASEYGFNVASHYAQRCQHLIDNNIAVWDVLFDCERPGSLDSAIVKNTEIVNDFRAFFNKYPYIEKIIFNGGAAQRLFRRHNAQLIDELTARPVPVQLIQCPSTSPAYASITKQAKSVEWAHALGS